MSTLKLLCPELTPREVRTHISVQGTHQGTRGQWVFTVTIVPHWPGAGDLGASVVNFTRDLWPLLTYQARTLDLPSVLLSGWQVGT